MCLFPNEFTLNRSVLNTLHFIYTRRQTNFHTKLPNGVQFLKCGTYQEKFSELQTNKKTKPFCPHLFLVTESLHSLWAHQGRDCHFHLLPKRCQHFWFLLWWKAAPEKTLRIRQGDGFCLNYAFCCKHQYHQLWPLHLESSIAHEMLYIDSHGNETFGPTMGYKLNTHTGQ